MAFSDPNISFGVTGLQGENINNPTALDFSKTGNPTLFVAQQNGEIWRFEIERQADGPDGNTLSDFVATSSSVISDIKTDTQNYDDDGSINNTTNRQTTGLVTTTDANGNDVIYVNSSDWRIAVGNDANLGTNSSQIHKLTLDPVTGAVISNIAIVRGLPRSEENHSVNGFDLAIDPVTGHQILWAAVGANTNNGAPGNNFAGTVDYPYSGVILKIDLDVLESYDVRTDGNGDQFILDLPTLDDPGRSNIDLSTLNILNPGDAPNFTLDDNGTGANGELVPDWAGGNNGLNAAKIVDKVLVSDGGQLQFVDNPLLVHSPGFRNPYDVEVTQAGEVFTWDNGPNTGWGGQVIPFIDNTPAGSVNYVEDWTQELATNLFNESGSQTFWDQLHYLGDTSDQFGPYGGFTSPIRAAAAVLEATFNPDGSYKPGAGNPLLNSNGDVIFADETVAQAYLNSIMIIYEEQGNGNWVDVTGTTGLPADLYDVVSGYNWKHPGSSLNDPKDYYDGTSIQDGTLYSPESQLFEDDQDGSLKTVNASTNGLTEYTASYFNGALDGAIVAASFNGNLYFEKPIDTDGDGRTDAVQSLGTINGFGSTPLTVIALGDNGLPGSFIDNDNDGVDDFAGLVVAGTYGADNVTFFIPGGQAGNPSTDLDLDGQDNTVDSHVGDPLDGRGVGVGENETLTWQFELSTPTTPPGAIPTTDSIAGDIGINAVWRNGVDPQVTVDGTGALYDPSQWNLGGASTFASIDEAGTGNAVGAVNDQGNVLGIGFEIQDNLSGITITSEMLNAFSYTPNTDASKTWDGGEKFGLMVGPGDQSTFVEATIAVDASSSTTQYGLQLVVEEGDIPNTVFVEIPGIEAPVRGISDPNLQIALDVDLTLGAEAISARARYVDNGVFTNWVSTGALALPDDVREAILGQYNNNGSTTGAVVGLVSSAPNGDDSFAASWDWIEVTGLDAVETTGTVLYRWNAGNSDVAAVDGGMDWIADTSVIVGGPTNVYTSNISTLDPSTSQYTVPTALFMQERWDPSSGSEMALEFGNGTLANGGYAVRLYMSEAAFDPGIRQFDVTIEDQLFLDDVDISATFGVGVGGVFEWTGQVTDGTVDIDFQRVLQNPQINGVEIVQLTTTPADPVVSADAANVSETDGTITLYISSNAAIPTGDSVTVDFEIRPITGSATPEVDYTAAGLTYDTNTGIYSGSAVMGAGQTSIDISVDILPDAEIEGTESFELHVTNVSGANATIGTAVATVTIDDLEDSVNGTGIGDFSDDPANPSIVNLTPGDTVVVSTQEGDPNRDYDYVTFVVPTGHELTSLTLTGFEDYDASTVNGSFLGLQAGTEFTELPASPNPANLLGGVIYSEFDVSADLLPNMADGVIENAGGLSTIGFTTPLGAGSYTLWWSQGGTPTTSTVTASVAPVNTGNTAPTIAPINDVTVNELQQAMTQITATDPDAGDVITLSAALADSNGTPVTGYTFTDNGDGTGDFSWSTPDLPATETFTATITASDGVNADVTSDFDITVNDITPPAGDTVLYRWNAGTANIAAIDGGPGWLSDTSVIVGGPTKVYKGNIPTLDGSVPTDTTPGALFTKERWDPASGTEMAFEFGNGTLASGDYAVRLFMSEAAYGPGVRQFDVSIEDQLFLDDIDLAATFGTGVGGMFEWTGQVTDGTIDIDFQRGLQNPQINGIEIIQLADGGPVLPTASLSVTPSAGSEDAQTQVTLTVTTSAAVSGDQTVDLALSGSGVAASDFSTAIPASITILDGATSASITIDVADDADVESLETATFTISSPSAGITLGSTVTGTLAITDNDAPANQPPSFTSPAAFNITENETAVGTVTTSDPENDTVIYGIAGGADQVFFSIDPNTGALSFISAPDFEAPADAGADNVYDVAVSATDGSNLVTQDIAVTVDDADETPPNQSPSIDPLSDITVDELQFATASVTATDPDAGDVITLSAALADSNGTPVTGYTFTDNGDGTGDFSWSTPDLPATETFTATITASDGVNADVTSDFDITVNDITPPAGDTVLYRWNAGTANIAAIDGGPGWLSDTSVIVGGPTKVYKGNIPTLDGSVPTDTTPGALFTKERWDPASGTEMAFEFGNGTLASGDYAVRLFMSEAAYGPGVRQFDVSIEDQLFLDDIDLAATFGTGVGGMFEWTGQVTDGTIDIDFQRGLQNPQINGIEIIQLADGGPVLPTASLSVTPSAGSEDAQTQVTLTVTTSAAVSGDQTVDLALSGSGVAASDFSTAIPASITILDGATSASITIDVADDADVESLETATFTISSPSAGITLGSTVTGTLAITDNDAPANQPPSFTSPAAFNITENETAVGTVTTSDPENDTVIYGIAGGADQVFFSIDPNTGALSFISAPDFEAPADAGADNVYDVAVSATDGSNLVTQDIAVTVDDADETPPNQSPSIDPLSDITVDELQFATASVTATDPDAGDVITLSAALADSNGTPVTGYTFTDNGDGTGDFSWSTPDLPATETFTATITASDGVNADVTSDFDITVNDITPPAGDTVLYRWNAGTANIAAIDGGPGWLSDTSVIVGGPTKVYKKANISVFDASVPTGTTPTGLFAHERWDPASGTEMAFEFGNGTLASGDYAVRLFMGEPVFDPGVRQFDVSIEDQLFLDDIDLAATFGTGVGGMFEWTGQVTDGTIDIDFQRGLQNPQINGIEIVQLDLLA